MPIYPRTKIKKEEIEEAEVAPYDDANADDGDTNDVTDTTFVPVDSHGVAGGSGRADGHANETSQNVIIGGTKIRSSCTD